MGLIFWTRVDSTVTGTPRVGPTPRTSSRLPLRKSSRHCGRRETRRLQLEQHCFTPFASWISQIRKRDTNRGFHEFAKSDLRAGYGVPESIRSVRFVPKLDPIASEDPKRALSHDSPTLEVWQGDLYGEPTMELMTTFSTSDRMATVYADGEMPFVRPGKSAVAFVHDAPDGYEIEFQSEFIDPQENTVSRTVTLDITEPRGSPFSSPNPCHFRNPSRPAGAEFAERAPWHVPWGAFSVISPRRFPGFLA